MRINIGDQKKFVAAALFAVKQVMHIYGDFMPKFREWDTELIELVEKWLDEPGDVTEQKILDFKRREALSWTEDATESVDRVFFTKSSARIQSKFKDNDLAPWNYKVDKDGNIWKFSDKEIMPMCEDECNFCNEEERRIRYTCNKFKTIENVICMGRSRSIYGCINQAVLSLAHAVHSAEMVEYTGAGSEEFGNEIRQMEGVDRYCYHQMYTEYVSIAITCACNVAAHFYGDDSIKERVQAEIKRLYFDTKKEAE